MHKRSSMIIDPELVEEYDGNLNRLLIFKKVKKLQTIL